MTYSALQQEWLLLQKQSDVYEKLSLIIKLVAVVIAASLLISEKLSLLSICLIDVLWLQDAIWKTFQERINQRLVILEQAIAQTTPAENLAMQFNREFLANRPSTLGLFKEYFLQACRPTVAYPYAVLITILLLALYF